MNMEYILQAKDLEKSFPGVQAVSGVSLDVERGTVHALMGENGAGKSTLVKMLAGFCKPDRGEILYKGNRITFHSPHDAIRLGISMIHQELLPFPELTVMENIFMGQELAYPYVGWLKRGQMHLDAARHLERLGVRLSPFKRVKELRVAEIQTVEIARALVRRSEVMITDEPTSAISEPEVEALFGLIRDLKRRHVAFIYISHRMEEVLRISDKVTVLRDGRHVGTFETAKMDPDQLITLMVGGKPAARLAQPASPPGEVALKILGLSRAGKFADIEFEVRRGEVLGIAGLMGAGRTELASAIFGLAPFDHGEIEVHGRRVRIAGPLAAIANGIAMVSEDRRGCGLVPEMSVKNNITLSSLRKFCRFSWINRREEIRSADDWIRGFSIRTRSRNQKVAHLSGGNQQKVVMAKAMSSEPDILILDEPTRGIDIGSKAEIYTLIRDLARAGKAVILISSELPEILSLSTRILVMREGRITAELDPRQTTQEELLKHAMPCGEKGGSDAVGGAE